MEPLESAIRGAKIQSFRHANPRDVLRRILEEEPKATKEELLSLCRQEIVKDEDMVDSVIEYWFSNNYYSLLGPQRSAHEARQLRQSHVTSVKADILGKIEERAQMILLDMVLPNGKALRDCTGQECARLGKQLGPWLANIAKEVKPNQLVGKILSEDRVRQLYKATPA